MDTSVTDVGESLSEHERAKRARCWALVLCGSVAEPERVGELLLLPAESGEATLVGRGDARQGDPCPRGTWRQQRPGGSTPRPPLSDRRLSRRQLVLEQSPGGLIVENIGRSPLRLLHGKSHRATLKAGEVFSVGGRYVFMVVKRRERWPALRFTAPSHPFGAPDADGLVGESLESWNLRDQIAFLAKRDQHTLLLGDSGVGKELVAGAIHAHSERRGRPLISRNAATIPESLFDAELFGNARNYPNPGMPEREGLIGAADGSSFFLDEIGELPEALQSHLLRTLDRKGEYHRLGESRTRTSDFRMIAATNRPVDALKQDVLARFVLRLQLSSLNERREDVPQLIRHLLGQIAERDADLRRVFFTEAGAPRVDSGLIAALMRHTWTRNVRELEALLWIALSTSRGDALQLTPELEDELELPEPGREPEAITPERIRASLIRNEGVKARVWRELGLKNRYVLRRLLEKYDISYDPE